MDWLPLKPSGFLSKSAGAWMGNSEGLSEAGGGLGLDDLQRVDEPTALVRW
jgi:hypothetical protein